MHRFTLCSILAFFSVSIFAQTHYLIDFGDPDTPTSETGWNNVGNVTNGYTLNLVNSEGNPTSVFFEVVTAPSNGYSVNSFDNSGHFEQVGNYPQTACGDSHYAFGSGGTYKISGLTPNRVYTLALYSNYTTPSTNRVTLFTVNGREFKVDASENRRIFTVVDKSDISGEFIIDFAVATGSQFGYLNVLDLFENDSDFPTLNPISDQAVNEGGSIEIPIHVIMPDNIPLDRDHIVILGSSTAGGLGPVDGSHAWANRLKYVVNSYTDPFTVINLARGGYTTREALPSPAGDPLRNITAALAYNPLLILINFPSNDLVNGISTEEMMENFNLIKQIGEDAGARVFLMTTQPRDRPDPNQRQELENQAFLILDTYGEDAINTFWQLADENLFIKTEYAAGDLVHFNDKGHHFLFHQALAAADPYLNRTRLTYQIDGPAFASVVDLGDGNAKIIVRPSAGQAGTYENVRLVVEDRNHAQAIVSFTLIINNPRAPNTPTNLVAEQSGSNVNLTWDDVSGEEGYRVERKLVSGNTFVQIAELGSGINYFTDVDPGAENYEYRIYAFSGINHSGYSNISTIQVSAIGLGDRYWIGNPSITDKDWSNTANWSETSGGPGGASVPSVNNTAIFNGANRNNGDCYISSDFSISNIIMDGYSGTLDLQGNDLTITNAINISTSKIIDSSDGASITINTTGSIILTGSTIDPELIIRSPSIILNSSVFNGPVSFEKTGTGTSVSSGGNTFNNLTTLTNTGSGIFRLASSIGDMYNSNVTFIQSSGSIQPAFNGNTLFGGDIIFSGSSGISLGEGTGEVSFSSAEDQSISLIGSTAPTISRLTINKSSGSITLNSTLNIADNLTLTNGIIKTSSENFLNILDNATVTGGSNNSHIDGPMTKVGNDAFTFPVGDAGILRPISISEPLSITDAFSAEYLKETQPFGVNLQSPLVTASSCEYWILDRTAGSSHVSVTLSWLSADCPGAYISDPSTIRVSHWNGTLWEDLGNGETTGDASSGTITTSSPVTNFSPFTLASTSIVNPLPIELLSFEAQIQENVVALYWSTVSELNNDYFTIEKSDNGLDFTSLAKVTGAGTSSETIHYSYFDDGPYPGLSFYRLKQTDYDGSFSYSKIERIHRKESNFSLVAFPNPAQVGEKISLNQESNLILINPLGQIIKRFEKISQFENDLSPGIYILRNHSGAITRLVIY